VGLPKVAFIGTAGTIASVGKTPLDLQDYSANGVMMHADEIVRRFPELLMVADVIPVRSPARCRRADQRQPHAAEGAAAVGAGPDADVEAGRD